MISVPPTKWKGTANTTRILEVASNMGCYKQYNDIFPKNEWLLLLLLLLLLLNVEQILHDKLQEMNSCHHVWRKAMDSSCKYKVRLLKIDLTLSRTPLSWKYFHQEHFYGSFLKIIYLQKHRRKGDQNFSILEQKVKKVQNLMNLLF